MNIKYRSGYAEGGFLDDGASVDPVSGNEVPTGSLAEEVRDDIPAQLSEGEFVVPADVVRFIGLDKLMKMREAAKVGLANMEAEGQMGGQPAPIMEEPMMNDPMMDDPIMDDSLEMDELIDGMDSEGFEGAVQQFADGGSVIPTYKDYTGNEFGSPTTVTFSTYINAAGDKITIPTLRGKPLRPVPEGYSLVVPVSGGGTEEDEPVPVEGGGESIASSTINSGPSADAERTQNYQRDEGQSGYQADLRRSERIRSDRANTIESLASPNMSKAEMDVMYAALTPQAKMIYDTRFRDEANRGFLDGFMADGKSPTDLLITAQKTADSINRAKGETEDGSGFLPNGEPIDWAKTIKYVASGLVLGPLGLVGSILKGMTDEEKEDAKINLTAVGKILGSMGEDSPFKDNTEKPNQAINDPYTKLNQDYWKTFTGDVSAEKRRLEKATGLNAYGHKIYKEPGSRTVWDDIAEVEANKQNTKDLQALRATEAQDVKNLAEVRANRAAAVKKAKADIAAKEAEDKKEEDKKEAAIEAARSAAAEQARIQKKSDNDARDRAIESAKQAAAAKVATEEAVRKAAQDRATRKLLDDQNRMQQRSTVNSGGDGAGARQRDSRGNETKGGEVNSGTTGKNTTGKSFNYGGLVSPSKPKIKKMRKDPTSGLAAKKKSKQKAQAKKGALAAKRT